MQPLESKEPKKTSRIEKPVLKDKALEELKTRLKIALLFKKVGKYGNAESMIHRKLKNYFTELYEILSYPKENIETILRTEIEILKKDIDNELKEHMDNNGRFLQNRSSSLIVHKMGEMSYIIRENPNTSLSETLTMIIRVKTEIENFLGNKVKLLDKEDHATDSSDLYLNLNSRMAELDLENPIDSAIKPIRKKDEPKDEQNKESGLKKAMENAMEIYKKNRDGQK